MSAFKITPETIIKLIRDALSFENLGDDPKEVLIFILKEIIQNADDCRSKRLSIGLSQGIKKAEHPLLCSPGILVVNDGFFRKIDSENIQSIGLSSNEDDSSKIGKFGIGLKTVFLICEAFFYHAKQDKQYTESSIESDSLSQFLNPWLGAGNIDETGRSFTDWDRQKFTRDDQTLLIEHCQLMGFEDGFKIWLPLRKEEHCRRGNKLKPIEKRYYSDSASLEKIQDFFLELSEELAPIFPLLKSLETVTFYNGTTQRKINLESGSRCFENFDTSKKEILCGEISFHSHINENEPEICDYSGWQNILEEQKLQSIKDEEEWSKAVGHCAVTIFSRPHHGSSAKLKVQWAVFLPMTKELEDYPIEGDSDYTLTLHGFFFPESDRR
jgi:hypothetical protein